MPEAGVAAIAHLVVTVFMAGVIVFVQIVHYPLMTLVGDRDFAAYEAAHTQRTGWVVIVPMVLELGLAGWLAVRPPVPADAGWACVGLGLVVVIWVATAGFQVPAHRRLLRGFDPDAHRRLVTTNWVRTVAWAARVPIAVALVI